MQLISSMVNGTYQALKLKLKKIRDIRDYQLYPDRPRHDDVYIVEFPKSGITWLSTIIANINLIESNEKYNVTFYNVHQFIPDIHSSKYLYINPIWKYPNYRFIKSHDIYNKNYKFVIYLIRNPFRVMNSYYLFLKQLNSFNGTFEKFITNREYGISSWINHIESWLNAGISDQRLHLIKYEDLLKKPDKIIKNLYQDLGIKVKEESINLAIENSNICKMKESEQFHILNNPNYKSLNFINNSSKSFSLNINSKCKDIIHSKLTNSTLFKEIYKDQI